MPATVSDYDLFIRPIEDRMIRSVWRVVRDPDDAEDAFQDALEKIWRTLHKIRRHPTPSALILRICINAAYDVLRRKARQCRAEAGRAVPENAPDPSSAADCAVSREDRAQVLDAVSRLPRKQATALIMHVTEGVPYRDIAQALGCGEATARTHVIRARAKLCKTLPYLAPQSSKEMAS